MRGGSNDTEGWISTGEACLFLLHSMKELEGFYFADKEQSTGGFFGSFLL